MSNFSLTHWIIFGGLAVVIFTIFKAARGAVGPTLFCKSCGHAGETRTVTRGSIWIELVLWLCFLVPGLIYSIWRLTTSRQACTQCGSFDLVPNGSPVALATKKQLGL